MRAAFFVCSLLAFAASPAQATDGAAPPTAPCASRHPHDTAAASARAVEVPISIEDGLVVVNAMLEDSGPYPMLLDTGAVEILTPAVAGALRLKPDGYTTLEGSAAHTVAAGVTRVATARIGGAVLHAPQFLVSDLPLDIVDRGPRPPLAGILGYQLFSDFVVRLDYQKRRLTLMDPADFHHTGPGACVPLVLHDRSPSIPAAADDVPGLFAIDTGSDGALVLDRHFVDGNLLEAKHPPAVDIISTGIDGQTQSGLTRLDRFGIAGASIRRPLTLFSPRGEFPIAGVSGVIGSKILREFVITFDYAHGEIWFEKSSAFGGPMRGGTTGFQVVKADDKTFRVVNVIAHTPAAEAGLAPGDVIVGVDEIRTATLAPSDFSDLMNRPEGTHVRLTLTHNGAARVAFLTLRELVP